MPEKTGQSLPDHSERGLCVTCGGAVVVHYGSEGTAHMVSADPRCQHCPCAADERSFMCEDCAGQADADVQELRDEVERLRTALERALMHVMYLGPGWRIITEALHPTAAVASDEQEATS